MKQNNRKKMTIASKTKSFCLCIIFVLAVVIGFSSACAEDLKPGEYQVKAAFLYNFVKFVEWPEQKLARHGDVVNICLLGEDPFGTAFDSIRNEIVGNKRLEIKYFKRPQHMESCHVVFISRSEREYAEQIVKALKSLSILTVGDTEGFAQKGVIINLYVDRNRVRFEINANAAKHSGLKISSKLMKLARIIQD